MATLILRSEYSPVATRGIEIELGAPLPDRHILSQYEERLKVLRNNIKNKKNPVPTRS